MTKDYDFSRAVAAKMLDIQEAQRDHLKAEPTVPPNPGHPALDRPAHYYLVRLYDHSGRMSGTQTYPYTIAHGDDYENERIGGAPTEAEAIARCVAGLTDSMTCNQDRESEGATRLLAASLITADQREPGAHKDIIDKIIAEIPDPDSPRAKLTGRLWGLLNHVQDHEPDPEIGAETRAKVTGLLDELERPAA